MILRMLQKLQEFEFQVVSRPGERHGNADRLSKQGSQTPKSTGEEKKGMFGGCPSAESWSEALGHIQMATSPESNQSSLTDIKLPLNAEMGKTLTLNRHKFEVGTTEWIERDTESD